jgi:transcriptional antiterminator
MEGVQMSDTIILDSKKCNAQLLTIHADGRITTAEHLKPTETAAEVLQIMREQWMDDIQSKKIREQEERIKQLEQENYTLLARLYSTRPRIPIEKKRAIADAPQNISISELARKFDVSYGTVARYRRQIKAKEAKP